MLTVDGDQPTDIHKKSPKRGFFMDAHGAYS